MAIYINSTTLQFELILTKTFLFQSEKKKKRKENMPQARASSVSAITLVVVVVLCLSIWAAPCFGTLDLLSLGFGVTLGNPCLESFVSTQGCVEELAFSFLSLQAHLLGPQCCKSALTIDDNCWPKIFPMNPIFPPQVKNYCMTIVPLPLPLPPSLPLQQ